MNHVAYEIALHLGCITALVVFWATALRTRNLNYSPRFFLRIVFSTVCAALCMLLVGVWITSYRGLDILHVAKHGIWITSGEILIDESWKPKTAVIDWYDENLGLVLHGPRQVFYPAGTGIRLSLWLPTTLLAALATIPWLRFRFSLRTLLLVMSIVALALGIRVISR